MANNGNLVPRGPGNSGKPKGTRDFSTSLTSALREAMDCGGRELMIAGILQVLEQGPKSRQFLPLVKEIFDRVEGKPSDSRDRAMDKMLGEIRLHPGRPNVPLPAALEDDPEESENGSL